MGKIRIYTNESADVNITEGLKTRGVNASSAWECEAYAAWEKDQLLDESP